MTSVVGVDVGGTFTDFFALEDGRITVYKRASTPDDPARAVLLGLAEAGFFPDEVVHGSTVATNALLERRGARTALITTAGFRDALVIGRQARPDMYALEPRRPEPLADSSGRFEVEERLDAGGRVITALSAESIATVVAQVADWRPESLAVCLLFSFRDPEHEHRIGRALASLGVPISLSSAVLPEHREYERMSTTVVNAYVAPLMGRYLARLEEELTERGVRRLRVMQSDGGSLTPETAGRLAVRTVLSGPAGGVAGALAVAKAAGIDDVIAFDMGGTSTDVSLCPGRLLFRTDLTVGGLPVRTPALDIHTVGAGGGSLAWIDSGAAIQVGPRSAGAEPGPACYGRGGGATVTDAQVVLGRVRPESFLGGRMSIEPELARQALQSIGSPLGLTAERGAGAVLRIANANIERAIRVVSVERGFDPRDFTLVAFGGAGPLHACDLAESLGMKRILVPPAPGVLSALGMAFADLTRDYVASVLTSLQSEDAGALIVHALRELEEAGRAELRANGVEGEVNVEASLDLRYSGQSFEVEVPVLGSDVAVWADAFHLAHARRYGHSDRRREVEAVNARVRVRVRGVEAALPAAATVVGQEVTERRVKAWFGRQRLCALVDRGSLTSGARCNGPAIITQMDSTAVVNPGWLAEVLPAGSLLIERAP